MRQGSTEIGWKRGGPARAGWTGLVAGLALLLATALPAAAAKRVALVVGNGDYRFAPALPNPSSDAAAVAARLRGAGFEVMVGRDLTRRETEEELKRFLRALDGADTALFYYSGHAVQVAGRNILVPVDANLASESDLELVGVDLDTVLELMRAAAPTQLAFLDACRDNPFASRNFSVGATRTTASATRGLARPSQGLGTLIAYATEPGNVAFDGTGALSPFTASFVRWVQEPGLEIRQLLTRVRNEVAAETAGKQVPWENSALAKDFFFIEPKGPPEMPQLQQVKLPAGTKTAMSLGLFPPRQPGGGTVRLVFDALPVRGELLLRDRPILPGERIDGELAGALAYMPADGEAGTVELIPVRAVDEFGGETRGVIAVALETGAKAPPAAVAQDLTAAADALRASIARKPIELRAGLGPQPLAIQGVPQAPGLTVEVTDLPANGTVTLGDKPLAPGTRIAAADLGRVGFEPDHDTPEAGGKLTLRVAGPDGTGAIEATATVTGALDPCDAAAGEPFDPQGVGKGRLPNELKPADAVAACSKAVAENPDVPRFLYQLGRAELAAGNVGVARAAFEKAAARGHVRSLYGLGLLNVQGAFDGADKARGFAMLEEGAGKGDPYAMHALGKRLFAGDGVPADVDRGFKLLVRAAEFGHTYAMNELGFQYKTGRVIPQDVRRALAYYRAAVEREDLYGFNNLGLMLRDGVGVAPDAAQAYRLFLRAARGGHPDAPFNIALMFEKGVGVERDPKQAVQWYEFGVERGDPWSALRVAEISAGAGVAQRDEARAALFLMRAAAFAKGRPSEEARARLSELPAPAKRKAAAEIGETLKLGSAAEGEKLLARLAKDRGIAWPKGLDELSVALAREAWLKGRPRFDLF